VLTAAINLSFLLKSNDFMISGDFKNRSDVKIAAPNVKENHKGSRGFGDRIIRDRFPDNSHPHISEVKDFFVQNTSI